MSMKKESYEKIINSYEEVSNYCNATGEPICLTKDGSDDLIVMSIRALEERENILKIKETLINVEFERAKGVRDITLEELNAAMDEIIKKA